MEHTTATAPAATTVASWVRDDAYRERAVRVGFIDRPAWVRFMGPVWLGLAIALVFSPWGVLGFVFGRGPLAPHVPALGLAAVLLALGGAQTFQAMQRVTARQYAFVGDTARWEFSAAGLAYRVTTPEGGVRHASTSQWGWFRALSVDAAAGLRLYRVGTVESYFIPASAFAQPGQDAAAALQAAVGWARAAGLPVRTVPAWDLAGVLGMGVTTTVMVALTMVQAALVAALPHLRWGRVAALFSSGVDTFWWAAPPCAAVVVALHLLLAAWQRRRVPPRGLPAQAPHLVLALAWGAALLAALQSVRSLVFDDALVDSSFLAPQAVVVAAVFVLLTGFVLYRGLVVPWAALRSE